MLTRPRIVGRMEPKLILVAVLLCIAHIFEVHGACSEAEQADEVQKCEKTFVETMVNANGNCSIEVNKIHECLETLSKKCYPQVHDKVIKQIVSVGMKQIQVLQFYCTETKLNYTWANVAPSVKDKLPPCAVSFDETTNQCSKNFRSEMQKTPKDRDAIYRSHEDSSKCIQQATPNCTYKGSLASGATKTSTTVWLNAILLCIASIAGMTYA